MFFFHIVASPPADFFRLVATVAPPAARNAAATRRILQLFPVETGAERLDPIQLVKGMKGLDRTDPPGEIVAPPAEQGQRLWANKNCRGVSKTLSCLFGTFIKASVSLKYLKLISKEGGGGES